MAITITISVGRDHAAAMQVEVDGAFDGETARRLLDAVDACRGIHYLRLDFRPVEHVDADALRRVADALSAPGRPVVHTRGLPAHQRNWLRQQGYDPVGLSASGAPWVTVIGRA